MGLFDIFRKKNKEFSEEDEYEREDDWEEPEPEPEPKPLPPAEPYVPPTVPLWDEPVHKPEDWPVMEPVSISDKVMRFMQEHTPEEIETASANATTQGMKAFQAEEYEKARGFFQLGSELGNAKAQALLGSMYIQGYQVPRDLAVGRAWLRRSAEQGNRQAAEILSKYVGESEPIAEELYESAKANLETDRRTGLYYLKRAAEMGLFRAQYEYGLLLIREEGDDTGGLKWVKQAAFGGYSRAMTYLGNTYLKGDLLPQSTSIAIEWYEQAARKNDPEAQLALGTLYAEGTAVPAQHDMAIQLLTQAANAGLSEAKDLLKRLYSHDGLAPVSVDLPDEPLD